MNPPFSTRVILPSDQTSYTVQLMLDGTSDTADLSNHTEKPDEFDTAARQHILEGENPLEASLDMLTIFREAVNNGIVGRVDDQHWPHIDQLSQTDEGDGLRWKMTWQVESMPITAWLILFGLLAQTCYAYEPLNLVTIENQAANEEGSDNVVDVDKVDTIDELALLAMNRVVPDASSELSFELDLDEDQLYPLQPLSASFEFVRPVSEQLTGLVEQNLNIWANVLVFGGFHLDYTEQKDFEPGILWETTATSDVVIEHIIDEFDTNSRSAINALLVLAQNIHLNESPLSRLSIKTP